MRAPEEDDDEGYISGAPDLAVEIASPTRFRPEMGAKAWSWLRRGAWLVWVVWPRRRQVDVWVPGHEAPVTLGIGDALDGADVLPDLRIPWTISSPERAIGSWSCLSPLLSVEIVSQGGSEEAPLSAGPTRSAPLAARAVCA